MMKKFLIVILFLCGFVNIARCDIIQQNSLQFIEQEFNKLDENTLVIFDVDETLIVAKDMVLRPQGEELIENILKQSTKKFGSGRAEHLMSLCMTQREVILIDATSATLVKELQNKNVKVIALTAVEPIKLGVINSLADWRLEELKQFGFDFSTAFPDKPYVELFSWDNAVFPKPIFKDGVLFSAKEGKGAVLQAFLETIGWMPKRVIFVDDKLAQCRSIDLAMDELEITSTSIHYVAVTEMPGELNNEVASLQFHYLIEKEKWLSDDEALNLLNSLSI